MNKRLLSKLEQGEGTTLMGKLFLTRRQRQVILKWFLFSLVYLVLQVMQDVLFSRIQIWGGCPDLVPGYLLLVCLMQGPGSGGLFALLAGVFRSLSGAVLGPVSLLVTTCAGAVSYTHLAQAPVFRAFSPDSLWINLWKLGKNSGYPQTKADVSQSYVYILTCGSRKIPPLFFWEFPVLTSTARGSVL